MRAKPGEERCVGGYHTNEVLKDKKVGKSFSSDFPIQLATRLVTQEALMSFLAHHGDAAAARWAAAEAAREEQRLRAAEARRLREEQERGGLGGGG